MIFIFFDIFDFCDIYKIYKYLSVINKQYFIYIYILYCIC